MITLDDKKLWQSFSAYANGEEVLLLVKALERESSVALLGEICWENIYHQNTLYQTTLATVPYLMKVAQQANDRVYQFETFVHTGIILAELDRDETYLNAIINDGKLPDMIKHELKAAFQQSFNALKPLGTSLLDIAKNKDEADKRYFLSAWAVAHQKYKLGKLFIVYSGNDEYVAECISCRQECYLWNESDELHIYKNDPVFNKKQPKISVSINSDRPEKEDFKWLVKEVKHLEVKSLDKLLPYFFGSFDCLHCKKENETLSAMLRTITC